MPVDKQVLLRYQVLNKCFRNRYREYTIDDLVDECNKALCRIDKPNVSKRTIQNDINTQDADYHIILNENLRQGRKRLYRYVDTSYSLPLYRMNDEERNKIEDAIYVLKDFEGEPPFGSDLEVIYPDSFRARIAEKIKITNQKYTGK